MTPEEYNNLFDDLLALMDPQHDDYLVVEFTDRDFEFLQDISAQKTIEGCLQLTDPQAPWLEMIHGIITQQIKVAHAAG